MPGKAGSFQLTPNDAAFGSEEKGGLLEETSLVLQGEETGSKSVLFPFLPKLSCQEWSL